MIIMKKIYLQPETEVINVLSIQMMAASPDIQIGDDEVDAENLDTKGEAWDIWEEE